VIEFRIKIRAKIPKTLWSSSTESKKNRPIYPVHQFRSYIEERVTGKEEKEDPESWLERLPPLFRFRHELTLPSANSLILILSLSSGCKDNFINRSSWLSLCLLPDVWIKRSGAARNWLSMNYLFSLLFCPVKATFFLLIQLLYRKSVKKESSLQFTYLNKGKRMNKEIDLDSFTGFHSSGK